MTDEEAVQAVTDGINALFAAHREAREAERRAYIYAGDAKHAYVVFANGHLMPAGHAVHILDALEVGVEATIAVVAEHWPHHAQQQVVWRDHAEVTRWEAQKASRKFDLPATPAGWAVRVRLVATPLGV